MPEQAPRPHRAVDQLIFLRTCGFLLPPFVAALALNYGLDGPGNSVHGVRAVRGRARSDRSATSGRARRARSGWFAASVAARFARDSVRLRCLCAVILGRGHRAPLVAGRPRWCRMGHGCGRAWVAALASALERRAALWRGSQGVAGELNPPTPSYRQVGSKPRIGWVRRPADPLLSAYWRIVILRIRSIMSTTHPRGVWRTAFVASCRPTPP